MGPHFGASGNFEFFGNGSMRWGSKLEAVARKALGRCLNKSYRTGRGHGSTSRPPATMPDWLTVASDGSCHKKYSKTQANVMSCKINVMNDPVNVMSGIMSGPHTTKSGQITLRLQVLKNALEL